MKVAKSAGLFKRLISRGIDFFCIALVAVGLLLIFTTPQKHGPWPFKEPWMFYIWSIGITISIFIFMVAIPLASKGWSIGMKVVKIKIVTTDDKNNLYKAIIKREVPFAFAWMFVSIMVMIVVNHTLIESLARIKGFSNSTIKLTNWEKTRITFSGSISGLIWFFQMWLGITIVPNGEKQGWHDRWAGVKVISTHITTYKNIEAKTEIIAPIKIENKVVEWINPRRSNE